MSPPRYWTFDWLVDRFGRVRSFGDLNAAWMGDRPASAAAEPSKSALRSYRYLPVARTAAKGFKKGSKVYLLDDPKGRTWIMTSFTDKIVTGLTIDKLETLGSSLALPPGWKFRAAALDKELVLVAKSGVRRHNSGRQREHLRSDRRWAEQFQPVTRLGCGVK